MSFNRLFLTKRGGVGSRPYGRGGAEKNEETPQSDFILDKR
jgi:hypothetical protein